MRSTIKEIMTHNTFLFSCFLALTLPFLSVANAAPIESKCSYDKEKMLELSPREFDQNYEEGWPSLVKDGECLEPAADLIHLYYTKKKVSEGAMKTLVWHEGNPVDVPWPPNLGIVDSFILCFGKTYAEIYAGCSKK